MKRPLILCSAALVVGCHGNSATLPANDSAANITALDEGNLSDDANITDVPADDGDAPSDAETNAQ